MHVNKLMLLVGDMGGTKTDLAIYSTESDANSLGELHGLLRREERLCTKNTSWALIERPYSCAPQAVGAVYDVYDRPGFFVQSQEEHSNE